MSARNKLLLVAILAGALAISFADRLLLDPVLRALESLTP